MGRGNHTRGTIYTVGCDCGKIYTHKIEKVAEMKLYLHAKAEHQITINPRLIEVEHTNQAYNDRTGTMKRDDGKTWRQSAEEAAAEHVKYIKSLIDAGEPLAVC